ncbi:MAG: hypothetical protein WDN10_02485 [bacterium]
MDAMKPSPLAHRFYFDAFAIDIERGKVAYTYTTDAGHRFVHELGYTFPDGTNPETLRPAAFALGLAELAGFWKAILAPEIVIKAGRLLPEQIAFWENLYTQGLGEFFYVNKIDFRGLVHVVGDPQAPDILPVQSIPNGPRRALVPFGGGKDSLVTGELLKKQEKAFSWFELEPLPFGPRLREVSGVTDCVSVRRDVAKNFAPVMELVKRGAPNGHVPITATYMMSAVLAAQANGFTDIIPSLERSASEGNVEYLGQNINHQYSKSYEFEKMAAEYVRKYVNPGIRLFSLIRPLYELQVVRRFIEYPQYFPYFVSCNRGLKTGSWCGECAKCAFMFGALSAFLAPNTVFNIFRKNLFEDAALIPLFEELIGMHEGKPFDCVGTFKENLLALYLSAKQYSDAGLPLPAVLAALPIMEGGAYLPMLSETTGEHGIPADYHQP